MSTLRVKGNRRVVLKNAVDPTTWSAEETLRNVSIQLDENGNVIAIPTFSINPQASPIPAGGSIGNVSIKDASNANLASVISGSASPFGFGWPTNTALAALAVTNYPLFYNVAATSWDAQEEASGIVAVACPASTSTQLLAAVSGKKYKIFALTLQYSAVSATTESITINEATSGALLLGAQTANTASSGGGTSQVSLPIPNNGVLQPTANNAIQVTCSASIVGYASIVYGAAR